MGKNSKMQRVVMGVLAMMFVVSLVLAIMAFRLPKPALGQGGLEEEYVRPEVVCTCCTNFLFCSDMGRGNLCHQGKLYYCYNIKQCYDNCCTRISGKWALVGYGCYRIWQDCSPSGQYITCLK